LQITKLKQKKGVLDMLVQEQVTVGVMDDCIAYEINYKGQEYMLTRKGAYILAQTIHPDRRLLVWGFTLHVIPKILDFGKDPEMYSLGELLQVALLVYKKAQNVSVPECLAGHIWLGRYPKLVDVITRVKREIGCENVIYRMMLDIIRNAGFAYIQVEDVELISNSINMYALPLAIEQEDHLYKVVWLESLGKTHILHDNSWWEQKSMPEAMEAFHKGFRILVDYCGPMIIEQDNWCVINMSHLQRGFWYVEIKNHR